MCALGQHVGQNDGRSRGRTLVMVEVRYFYGSLAIILARGIVEAPD